MLTSVAFESASEACPRSVVWYSTLWLALWRAFSIQLPEREARLCNDAVGPKPEARSDGALRGHPIRQGVETLGESGVRVAGGIVDIIRAVDAAVADILELAALCRIDGIIDLDQAGKSGRSRHGRERPWRQRR